MDGIFSGMKRGLSMFLGVKPVLGIFSAVFLFLMVGPVLGYCPVCEYDPCECSPTNICSVCDKEPCTCCENGHPDCSGPNCRGNCKGETCSECDCDCDPNDHRQGPNHDCECDDCGFKAFCVFEEVEGDDGKMYWVCDNCGEPMSSEQRLYLNKQYEEFKTKWILDGNDPAEMPKFNEWLTEYHNSTIDPINIITAELYFNESDIIVPAPGIPLSFERYYGSEAGWRHSWQWSLESYVSDDFGLGVYNAGGYLFASPSYSTASDERWDGYSVVPDSSDILLTTGGGMDYEFNESSDEPGVFYPEAMDWKIVREAVVENGETNAYRFTVHQPGGLEYVFGGLALECVQDGWGNRIDFSYSSNAVTLTHTCGTQLILEHSGDSNQIERAWFSDDLYAEYAYSTNGLLTNVVRHVSGETFEFSYTYDDDGKMLSKINPRGDEYRFTHSETTDNYDGTFDYEDSTGYSTGGGEDTVRTTSLQIGEGWYKHTVQARWGYEWEAWAVYADDEEGESERQYRSSTVTYDYGGGKEIIFDYNTEGGVINSMTGPHTGDTNSCPFGAEYTYDGKNQLTALTYDESTRSTSTVHKCYDEQSRVTAAGVSFNAANPVWQTYIGYDTAWGLPSAVTNAEGHFTHTVYTNGSPSCVKTYWSSTESFDTHYAYYTNGLVKAVTNANQHVTQMQYDAAGNPSLIIPPAGPQISTVFNAFGQLESSELLSETGSSSGRITEYDVNAKGWVKEITYPDGLTESFLYDNAGNVTNRTDRAGRTAEFEYAPDQRLLAATRYLYENGSNAAVTVGYDFDKMFNTLRITEPRGRYVESYKLDLHDRVTSVTNIESQTMDIGYYVGGMVSQITRFDGSTISNAYDSAARLLSTVYRTADILSATVGYEYWPDGEIKTVSDGFSTVTNTYDWLNRPTAVTSSVDSVISAVSHKYGGVNLTNTVVGISKNEQGIPNIEIGYSFDSAERLMEITAGLSTFDRQTFDCIYNPENGLVSSVTNLESGLVCSYAYDLLDRATNITYTLGTNLIRSLDYEFDEVSMIRKKRISNNEQGTPNIEVSYTYDSLDRLVAEKRTAGGTTSSLSFSYDLAGNRRSKTSDGRKTEYTLGAGNRLSSSSTGTNQVLFITGSASEPIGTDNRWGQLWISNLTANSGTVPGVSGEDFFAELPAAENTTNTIVAAIRDMAGNVGFGTNDIWVGIADGTNCADQVYEYDTAGCLTNLNGTTLEWDERYRLKKFVVPALAGSVEYAYDVLGRRASRTEIPPEGGTTNVTFFIYNGNQVVADLDENGGLLRTYVWGTGIDNLLCFTDHTTSNTYYAVKDHQNTVLALVDDSGIVVESYEYSAYGEILDVKDSSGNSIGNQQSEIGNRYTFQGRETDWKTGLIYFRARWYNPETGRWLSKDPLGIEGGLNLYAFCDNNPVIFTDPSGLCGEGAWNPSGHAVVWKGGKIGFFAVAGIELGSITLKFDNGYYQDYQYISSGIGVGFSLAFDLGGDVYGVYSPSDYTGSFWNTDVSIGYSYGTSWWGDTANDSHSMGSVGATATYQGYWTSGAPYQ